MLGFEEKFSHSAPWNMYSVSNGTEDVGTLKHSVLVFKFSDSTLAAKTDAAVL